MSEVRGQCQMSDVRGQMSEVGCLRSEVRRCLSWVSVDTEEHAKPNPGIRNQNPRHLAYLHSPCLPVSRSPCQVTSLVPQKPSLVPKSKI
jgi:hypothetical protein